MKKMTSQFGISASLAAAFVLVSSVALAQDKKAPAKKPPAKKDTPAATEGAKDSGTAGSGAAGGASAGGKVSYGMAGCGLGTMVMKKDTMFDQILAMTTNSTSASQTFGITSGTSGCDGVGPAKSAALRLEEQKVFVTNNLSTLEREVAQGGGETVASLAFVSGCADEALPTFGKIAQSSHAELFQTGNVETIVEVLNNKIKASETLRQYCL